MPSISPHDLVLLMHFLDNVFPLQYPVYTPGVADEGRGWLLNLLLCSKPFYHAALALSAYHRRVLISADANLLCRAVTLVQEEKNFEICIKSVSQTAQNSCSKAGVGITAAFVQLAIFEVLYSVLKVSAL
jgi:hypothetical protein